jgi:hypothetical protein
MEVLAGEELLVEALELEEEGEGEGEELVTNERMGHGSHV